MPFGKRAEAMRSDCSRVSFVEIFRWFGNRCTGALRFQPIAALDQNRPPSRLRVLAQRVFSSGMFKANAADAALSRETTSARACVGGLTQPNVSLVASRNPVTAIVARNRAAMMPTHLWPVRIK